MVKPFVHLHLHTEFSVVDGIVRISDLVKKSAALGMPAVAVTDHINLFGLVKFYKAALAAGIKPIMGAEIWLENPQDDQHPTCLVLLCQNDQGYQYLTQLLSLAYFEGQTLDKPLIKREWLETRCEGLIALSGALMGDIGRALLVDEKKEAVRLLQTWQQLFPDRFYLELQRTGCAEEEHYIHQVLELAHQYNIPVVATNDVRFLASDDYEAHEARVCIGEGNLLNDPRRPRRYSDQQYLRSSEEMAALFSEIPEALENTLEIAKRCNLTLTLGENYLPNFPVPKEFKTIEDYLENEVCAGLETRLNQLYDVNHPDFTEQRKPYDERLNMELNIIKQMGFAGYFLIVADFIQWAKENGVPVGPGRGSGAGSLVAYALKITDLDPLRFNLLFERFLNPERISMPDFDVDFCMEGRDRVIDYVAQKYGRKSVSQIITYGTMAARAVVRDVGRVLGHGYGFVDKIAKLIPFEIGMTLDRALEVEEALADRYKNDDEIQNLIDLARKLEGVTRNVGKHAGGVVISPSLLTDFTPLYCEPDGTNLVTQFDKDDVEAIGLVKFDFLGLRTLTIINWAVQAVNRGRTLHNEPLLDISLIPLDDAPTFQLLKACQTTAVFQLESRGMKDLIKRLQPDCFEDIIALVALFRPGPLQSGMVDDFINRKHGRAKVTYLHPALSTALDSTYGVILYQEQVMQIAQQLAGYSLGSADLLRKAMGKKKPEEMAKQRKFFLTGAVERGVDEEIATNIFNLMEKFAGYGFNKAHSAAYALLAYQTAWLKTHYPAEFMAAVLSSDMDNTDKVIIFIEECRAMKLTVRSPNVNYSQYQFVVEKGSIVYGLGAVKGVGQAAIENIIAAREVSGEFKDLYDFCTRVDLRKVNRRVLEALIKSGSMDGLGPHRASMLASLDSAILAAEQFHRNDSFGQNDLFGADDVTHFHASVEFEEVQEWHDKERLQNEKETLGLYLTGHPLDQYQEELKHLVSVRLSDLKLKNNQSIIIGGFIVALRTMITKRGDRMAFVALEDGKGRIEVAIFSDLYQANKHLLQKDQLLFVEGDVSADEYSGGYKISARALFNIEQMRESRAKYLLISANTKMMANGFTEKLSYVLKPFLGGGCAVCIDYLKDNAHALLPLDRKWKVTPNDDLIQRIQNFFPESEVKLTY